MIIESFHVLFILLLFFCFLIAMAKVRNNILNKSSDRGQSFLIADIGGNASRCPSFNVKLILCPLYIIFIVWRYNLLDLICSWLSLGKYVELWPLSQFVEKIKWFLFLFLVCIIMLINIFLVGAYMCVPSISILFISLREAIVNSSIKNGWIQLWVV